MAGFGGALLVDVSPGVGVLVEALVVAGAGLAGLRALSLQEEEGEEEFSIYNDANSLC